MYIADIRIFLHPYSKDNWYELGQEIKGEIIIRPQVDLEIIHFGYNIGMQDRGRITSSYLPLKTKYLGSNRTFDKGEEYKFEFTLENDKHITYKGINMIQLMKIEVFIRHKTVVKEDAGFLGRIKPNFIAEAELKKDKYVNFKEANTRYSITTKKIELKPRYKFAKYIYSIFFGIIFFILFTGIGFNKKSFWLLGSIAGIVILITLIYFLIVKSLNRLQINFESSEAGKFSALIRNDNNWRSIAMLTPSLVIIEEVIDNRGTSSTTLRETIYEHQGETRKYPRGLQRATFKFPKNIPTTISLGEASIIWYINLKIKTAFGLIINYRSPIDVKMETLPSTNKPKE